MCRIMGEASPRLFILFLALVFTGNLFAAEVSDDGVWQRADERKIAVSVAGDSKPRAYRALTLNREILQNVLRQAPLEFSSAARTSNVVLSLPMPDGSFSRYRIEESPVIAPELAAQFPQIKTYRGQSIDDPFGVVRFGWTEGGFHALGFSEHDAFVISVLEEGDTGHYISYWNADSSATPVECLTQEHETMVQDSSIPSVAFASGSTLRTYTVAIGATGEYTKKFGGTQSGALNDGIVPAINSVNAILEREFAIRLVVSGEQMKTIYTDATTDPYSGTNSDKAAQNQANLDSVIGSADYDIGHVFNGDGGSGLARLGSVCGSSKAWAISTSYQPKDISFIVELVAHEMGHQFSAHHSFNGTTTNCANRNGSTAWEPASGSTIMSYSGSCSGENLQAFSDPYYHVGNYDQVMSLVGGLSCDTETSTGNNPPTVNAGPDYTIPQSTPFTLTATGNDADGDPLSYSWEEWDLGAPSPPSTDDGSRPIFRSFAPVTSPSRTFPKLSDILSNKATLGESLPTTDRVLKLRVTARDNRASGGGVANDMTVITVENNAGPFQVTSPNSAVTWNAGAQTITWNVAGTNVSPISTANVSILLSTDGGLTFPTTLVGSTPNDGTQTVTIPNVATSTARVKVAAVGNIFFDISNTNFTIGSGGCTPITLSPASLGAGEVGTAYNQTISASGGTAPYSFAKTSGTLPTGLTLGAGGTLSGTPSAAGTFNFTVTSTDDKDCTGNKSYSINVTGVACSPITLSPSSLGAGEVGTPYNQTISASGGTAPYSFAKTSGTLPTGLTLGGGGTLSGTPTAAGTFNFTVTSTDDKDCTGNKSYSINVTGVACSPITLSPSSLGAGEVGTPYNQTISASGGTGPYSFAKTSGTLPTGLTLGGGGTLSGTPSAAGTFNFTVTSTDDNDCTGNKSYSINVTTVACSPITLSPSSLGAGEVGTPYNQTISASGGTAPYSFAKTSGTLPTGLTLGGGGTLSGTPTAAGTFNFTVTSTDDNECTGNKSYSINVTSVACSPITLSPSSLPAGLVGTSYNQTITASGGTAPYSFARTSGTLPTGLTLGPGGLLSGTPTAAGTFNFTVTSTDDNECTGNKSYSINVTIVNTCLFCDDFEDNVLSTAWTYSESAWSETGGRLVGTSPKKAMALATPAFDGCSNCTVESQMRTSGGEGNRVWMFAWYVDKSNSVELLMKEESDMWILKQKWNGSSAKAKAKVQINPGVSYTARISFDGSQFRVFVNNTLLITMPKLMGSSPIGTVGFQTKGTTAGIGKIEVK